jgi:hypothetical protein
MRKIFLLLIVVNALNGCVNNDRSSKVTEDQMKVSFEQGSLNKSNGIYAAYTNDADSLWMNEEWVKSVKNQMKNLSSSYSTILLFNNKNNTPNVAAKGMNYSTDFDKYLVCGYWLYPSGKQKFCYGGVKSDGNFEKCD